MIATIVAALFCVALWSIVLGFELDVLLAAGGTGLVGLALLGRWLHRRHRARRASREIERALQHQAEQFASRARPDQQPEVAALKAEFDRAIAAIRGSKLAKGGTGALYALPWYVIIGPPGAGKSTAIRNSGLNFPHQSARGSVRGVGGTRNCDWWLANEAVILDTAGRYTTEDDDNEEWLAFLDMLKRTRTRRPINGVMVALSIETLLRESAAALEATAEKLRTRLDEVMGRLGLVLPVYLMFTKCDLLPGFVETFCELRRTERGQVWGFTLPVGTHGEPLVELIGQRFDRVAQVLERRSLARLAEARQLEQRERIYALPEEFEALREPLLALSERLFADNVYHDAPIVRGVYFTSGTQEGSAVGRAMSAMAAAYGLASERPPPATTEPKSYFLGELFSHVIFPDAHLAGESLSALRRRRYTEVGVAAALGLATLGVGALPALAYLNNRRLLGDVERAVEAVRARTPADSAGAALPGSVLTPLREVALTLVTHAREGVPVGYGMGLYQGDRLVSEVQRYYTSTVRRLAIEPFVEASAHELARFVVAHESLAERPTVEQHARVYALLKGYLLLTGPKEESEPALSDPLRGWLLNHVVGSASGAAGAAPRPGDLAPNVDAYLDLLRDHADLRAPRDAQVVAGARALLRRIPAVQLAVDRIVAAVDALDWDLTVEQLVGGAGLPIASPGRVRGAFTRRAWDGELRKLLAELPLELLGERWVLEAGVEVERVDAEERLCQLRAEYFTRYVEAWKQFLGSVRMEEPGTRTRALAVLQDLTRGEPPPLERLMRQVAYHARLDDEDGAGTSQREQPGLLAKLRDRVIASPAAAKLLGPDDPCQQRGYPTSASVRSELRGFYAFGVPDEPAPGDERVQAKGQPTAAQIYQEQLAFMRDAMQAYADDPASAEPLLARLQSATTRIKGLVDAQEVGWRPRFDALLWPPINGANAASSGDVAGQKSAQWCTSVVLAYDRALRGRYPFAKGGQDAALADVAAFYRPGSGILWSAYDGILAKDVTRTGDRYEPRLGSSVAGMYSSQLIAFLNRSQRITSALFPTAQGEPSVSFEVRVRPSPGVASIVLTIDGQVVDFHNGPERWVPIRWPGESKQRGAHMRVRGAGIDEVIAQEGEWGLMRLVDSGTVSASAGERSFSVQFRLRTQNDVVIDLRPARQENPLIGKSGRALEVLRGTGVDVPRSIAAGSRTCAP